MDLVFFGVLIWLLCGAASAAIASKKGEGFLGFIVGLLFGPFGIVFALLSDGDRQTCPFCKSLIHKEATVCPHCRRPSLPPLEL